MATTATSSQAQPQAQQDKTVTGYPVTYAYAAPPQQPQPQHRYPHPVNPVYYPSNPNRPFKSTLLCRLIVIAVGFLSFMAFVSFIMWLIFKPRFPEFQIDSASVSQLNTTESKSSLNATWKFSLTVTNPNKKLAVSYNSLQASVLYRETELETTQLAPFSQVKGNETRLEFQLGAVSEYVGESVVNGIESDKKERGQVGFGLGIYGWVRFKSGWWEMRWRLMKVYCDGVNIGVSNSSNGGSEGSLVSRVDPCQVAM